MFATLSNGCATSTSGVLSIALSSLMIPVSISILAYLVLENLPTLQSWQKRLLLLAGGCLAFLILFYSFFRLLGGVFLGRSK